MSIVRLFVIGMMAICATASAQEDADQDLARRLAERATRESAVAEVAALGTVKVTLLPGWIGASYSSVWRMRSAD